MVKKPKPAPAPAPAPAHSPAPLPSTFPLLSLPNELLWMSAEHLSTRDLNNLLRTNRRLSHLLAPILHAIGAEDKDSMPALCWAIKHSFNPLAKVLIQRGMNINVQDCYGRTPLSWATCKNSTEMVRLLLDCGARQDILAPKLCISPLHLAAKDGLPEVAKMLVDGGADLEYRCRGSWTALMLALRNTEFYRWRYYFKGDAIKVVMGLDDAHCLDGLPKNKILKWKSLTEVARVLLESGASIIDLDTEGQHFCRKLGQIYEIEIE